MRAQVDPVIVGYGNGDDTIIISDSASSPVFINEKPDRAANYPFSREIHRDHTPDWVLYFLMGFLVILAWLRLIYTKFIDNIFKAAFNFLLAQKVYREPGIVQWRIFVFLNLFYYFSTSVFLYLVLNYFEFFPTGFKNLELLGILAAVLASWSLFRLFIMKLTGIVFDRQSIFQEAIFHSFLFNKIIGIVLTPFILFIAYTRGIFQDIFIFAGLGLLGILMILRLVRLLFFVKKSNVLLFYFILYLCTLEIIPLLVAIKLIFSL